MPDLLTGKQLAEAVPDPPATIIDRGDGSYLVSHTMTRKGRYDVSVELGYDSKPRKSENDAYLNSVLSRRPNRRVRNTIDWRL